jgi:DNA-binding transcriptional ArsR family regulator
MSAGELSEHFAVSKPTMSAHFAVLQEANLIEADKQGRTILYRLKISVVEEALLGFVETLGLQAKPARRNRDSRTRSPRQEPFKEEA